MQQPTLDPINLSPMGTLWGWIVDRWEFFVHLQDGSKADWLSGVGATSALIFAFFAVRAAHKQNKNQAAQLKEIADDKRREQAEKIAAWCHRQEYSLPETSRGVLPFPLTSRRYIVRNASDVPVYGACVWLVDGARRREVLHAVEIETVPPGQEEHYFTLPDGMSLKDISPAVSILFMDAGGRYWERGSHGNLTQLELSAWIERRPSTLKKADDCKTSLEADEA